MPNKKQKAGPEKKNGEVSKPKRDRLGRLQEKPAYLTGRRKGSRNKISKDLNKILWDEKQGGVAFTKLLFKKGVEHLRDKDNDRSNSQVVKICAAFMLKTMPNIKTVDASLKVDRGMFKDYDEFLSWTPQQKEHFVKTGEMPKPVEYADYKEVEEDDEPDD